MLEILQPRRLFHPRLGEVRRLELDFKGRKLSSQEPTCRIKPLIGRLKIPRRL